MLALLLLAATSLVACGAAGSTPPAPGVVGVVATSTVFADLVRQVAGAHVAAKSLVPAGADVHTYQPTPADLVAIADAKVVVMNGLGLDDWLDGTITSAGGDADVVRLGERLPGVQLIQGDVAGEPNPHLWMDVANAQQYVTRIGDALAAADPAAAADYRAGVTRTNSSLADLDSWIRGQIATLPSANRMLVTFHDALPYYARAYGLTIVGVAVEAPGQDPSAGEIAALVDAIKAAGVRAVFSENQFPTDLVDRLADEAGATVVASLYDDSLGDPPVTSYQALMRWDTEQIVAALR